MEETNVKKDMKPQSDPDEINLLEYFYVLVKNKWLIIVLTILGFIGGYISAQIIGPKYVSDAVISPKETESVKTPNLSGLGMFGGFVASQLNLRGNASLEKVELILNTREFNAELVKEKKLLPLIYPELWDSVNSKWLNDFKAPKPINVGGYIRGEYLKMENNENGTMTIRIESEDSLFSYNLLSAYIDYLDTFIKKDVQEDARGNRDYLENQLIGITDPLLRTKIQELIANEVEKMMVVSKEAFKIIDPIFTYKSFKEKKLFPLVFSAVSFFLIIIIIVLMHTFSSANKTLEDEKLIKRIYREIVRIPFKK